MGLGSFLAVSLADARELARTCRKQLQADQDPIAVRAQAQAAAQLEAARSKSFKDCAEAYVTAHKVAWRNDKHQKQWSATLKTYAEPIIGSLPVASVNTDWVLKVLDPIWSKKPETASRVRGRIESILDWATVRGYRTGENPARWRGLLDNVLPSQRKVSRTKHHAALPYSEIGMFLQSLRNQDGIAASALEFAILTAARTSEVIGATWSEINLDTKIWCIPGGRMKAGREHRVPLSASAIVLLRRRETHKTGQAVFPGQNVDSHLSNMAMLATLKRMNRADLTTHGFRSTFRDWVAECTDVPREVAEMALAHLVGNQVEAAYRRGDLFEKRKTLMGNWANYCETVRPKSNVTPLIRDRS